MKPTIPLSIWAVGRAFGVAIAMIAIKMLALSQPVTKPATSKSIQAAEKADAEIDPRERLVVSASAGAATEPAVYPKEAANLPALELADLIVAALPPATAKQLGWDHMLDAPVFS